MFTETPESLDSVYTSDKLVFLKAYIVVCMYIFDILVCLTNMYGEKGNIFETDYFTKYIQDKLFHFSLF